ncbi:hypothetical protein LZZ90_08835 [Flavobacterium sp. SM15]|nr:hypothetical protein [Flavobacterium sp. SM15]MCG2611610.1 hypothetical protein [Flavobacterium sp. SM15]
MTLIRLYYGFTPKENDKNRKSIWGYTKVERIVIGLKKGLFWAISA